MTDDEFLARFEAATLAPELFHYQDHVHMAFLYLQRHLRSKLSGDSPTR